MASFYFRELRTLNREQIEQCMAAVSVAPEKRRNPSPDGGQDLLYEGQRDDDVTRVVCEGVETEQRPVLEKVTCKSNNSDGGLGGYHGSGNIMCTNM